MRAIICKDVTITLNIVFVCLFVCFFTIMCEISAQFLNSGFLGNEAKQINRAVSTNLDSALR